MDLSNVDNEEFELIIIGGGSAAFAAAIHADSIKISTLMINGGLPFGGTCVNVGCVPSKFLIRVAESIHHASASNFNGVNTGKTTINFAEIIKQKKALVNDMQQHKYMNLLPGLTHLKVIAGKAKFIERNIVEVNGELYEGTTFAIQGGPENRPYSA